MKINSNGTIDIRKALDDNTVNIFLTGDANPRFSGEERVLAGESPSILAPMRPYFQAADLSITQFETVLTTDDTPIIKSGPNLKNDPGTIEFFREWNGDVCLMANNHTGDFGSKPLMDTLDIIHKAGFKTVGAGKNLEEAYQPLIVERFGITIGILNFCETEFGGALADKPGSATLNPMLNVRQIMKLRPQVDVLLVVTHGGNEQDPFPSPRVVDMLHTFADVGADMVVNIHTHCPRESKSGTASRLSIHLAISTSHHGLNWPRKCRRTISGSRDTASSSPLTKKAAPHSKSSQRISRRMVRMSIRSQVRNIMALSSICKRFPMSLQTRHF